MSFPNCRASRPPSGSPLGSPPCPPSTRPTHRTLRKQQVATTTRYPLSLLQRPRFRLRRCQHTRRPSQAHHQLRAAMLLMPLALLDLHLRVGSTLRSVRHKRHAIFHFSMEQRIMRATSMPLAGRAEMRASGIVSSSLSIEVPTGCGMAMATMWVAIF